MSVAKLYRAVTRIEKEDGTVVEMPSSGNWINSEDGSELREMMTGIMDQLGGKGQLVVQHTEDRETWTDWMVLDFDFRTTDLNMV